MALQNHLQNKIPVNVSEQRTSPSGTLRGIFVLPTKKPGFLIIIKEVRRYHFKCISQCDWKDVDVIATTTGKKAGLFQLTSFTPICFIGKTQDITERKKTTYFKQLLKPMETPPQYGYS